MFLVRLMIACKSRLSEKGCTAISSDPEFLGSPELIARQPIAEHVVAVAWMHEPAARSRQCYAGAAVIALRSSKIGFW
jgi:hypothetical protein